MVGPQNSQDLDQDLGKELGRELGEDMGKTPGKDLLARSGATRRTAIGLILGAPLLGACSGIQQSLSQFSSGDPQPAPCPGGAAQRAGAPRRGESPALLQSPSEFPSEDPQPAPAPGGPPQQPLAVGNGGVKVGLI